MKKRKILIFLLIVLNSCSTNTESEITKKTSKEKNLVLDSLKNEIDSYLNLMIEDNDIPGMALAVIKDGKTIYETYKGVASLETQKKVDENTLFRIYSTTKIITVTAIFQLIEDNKIGLNDSIAKYINGLPSSWKHIKIHHLIAHSSGLPDIMNYDLTLADQAMLRLLSNEKMKFDAGEKFAYNQTNYWFLTKIIEKVSNLSYEEFVFINQFEKDKNNIAFSSNHTDTIPGKAPLYWYQAEKKAYDLVTVNFGKRANSATGLTLSLNKFIQWNKRLDENLMLHESTKQMMWTPYEYKQKESEFLYGWGTYDNHSIGFTGSGVTGYRKFLKDDMTIIFLSNGFNKPEPAHNKIIDKVANIVAARH